MLRPKSFYKRYSEYLAPGDSEKSSNTHILNCGNFVGEGLLNLDSYLINKGLSDVNGSYEIIKGDHLMSIVNTVF